MQNQLNAVAAVQQPAATINTNKTLCRIHVPSQKTITTTKTKTPIVIQKSETFHIDSRENNLVIFDSEYYSSNNNNSNRKNINVIKSDTEYFPKLTRTTSSDTGKTVATKNKIKIEKPKSDYALTNRGSGQQQQQRKNYSLNLYENYETYDNYNHERKPLLSEQLPCDRTLINVKNDENNILVYTTKSQRDHKPVKRTSLPGANCSKIDPFIVATQGQPNKAALHWRHSWYAPVYGVLEEETEQNFKESASLHNLAGVKKLAVNGTHESASLLDQNQYTATSPIVAAATVGRTIPRTTTTVCTVPSGLNDGSSITTATTTTIVTPPSLGTTAPRKRKFEQFFKNLVSRRASKEPISPPLITKTTSSTAIVSGGGGNVDFMRNTLKHQPSDQNLTRSRIIGGSTASLTESVHQKLWSVVPLLRKNGSCGSLHLHSPRGAPTFTDIEYMGLRKCETVLALTHHTVTTATEPIRPLNRLRNCASIATCSRCSSLMSLAGACTAGSKYSLNGGVGNNFIPVSNSNSNNNFCSSHHHISGSNSSNNSSTSSSTSQPTVVRKLSSSVSTLSTSKCICKLCLGEFKTENLTKISQCGCSFCTECMTAYVEFEIAEGAYEVSCPDAMCPAQGVISIAEITLLAASGLVDKHHRYRLNREVELDKYRTWCPKAGCETICLVGQDQHQSTPSPSTEKVVTFQPSSSKIMGPCAVHCPTCRDDFCSGCKKPWHPTMTCEENTKRLAATGKIEILGIPFDSDLIKCCPMCSVPIEKDEGCAQMMCKRCKHVFCWYCLASLDDDFLLRHYDKGPCKNKLGHSRASVVWHRAQVIGIFAGFGILLLVASPLLLLAAPCIVCCKCRICSGAAKLEDHDTDLDDGLQR